MRTVLAATALVLISTLAAAEDAPATPGPRSAHERSGRLERRLCGTCLAVTRHVVRGDHDSIRLTGEAGAPDVELRTSALLVRGGTPRAWARTTSDPALVFPELLGDAVLASRFEAAPGKPSEGSHEVRLRPSAAADRETLRTVSIRRSKDGLPERCVLDFADGTHEVRDYSGWAATENPVTVPAPEASVKAMAWPPERTWPSELERTLEEIQGRLGTVRDLSGRFVREKRTILLRRPSVASGRFRFVPGRLLWSDEEPREAHVLLTRERMDVYDPESKRLERFPFGDSGLGRYVFLGFEGSLSEGLRALSPVRYGSEDGSFRLDMEPVGGRLADHVRRLTLVIDITTGTLREMSYSDPSGDSVTTRLLDLRRNTGLGADDVAIRVASGTRIIENHGGGPWR